MRLDTEKHHDMRLPLGIMLVFSPVFSLFVSRPAGRSRPAHSGLLALCTAGC